MSTPRKDYPDRIQGVIQELISAQSSLNMQPQSIEDPDHVTLGFLSETDKWAKHAYEHIEAALSILIDHTGYK